MTVVTQQDVLSVCAGVREADWSLVSGEHRLLSLHAGSVLSGQRGGSEGESQQPHGSTRRGRTT